MGAERSAREKRKLSDLDARTLNGSGQDFTDGIFAVGDQDARSLRGGLFHVFQLCLCAVRAFARSAVAKLFIIFDGFHQFVSVFSAES